MSEANKTQVGGTHYQTEFQHWDFCGAAFGDGYFKGVATKYVARWRKKGGVEDLQKARHYIVKLDELVEVGEVQLLLPMYDGAISFIASNKFPPLDAVVIDLITSATERSDLENALAALDDLIRSAK